MSPLELEYFLFAFIASCGILQLAAALSKLKGLLFLGKVAGGYVLATLTIGGAFGWFFAWGNRLPEKIMHTGLEGAQQFFYFILAAFAALAFTLLASSVVNLVFTSVLSLGKGKPNSTRAKPPVKAELGLDNLQEMTYFEAIWHSFREK